MEPSEKERERKARKEKEKGKTSSTYQGGAASEECYNCGKKGHRKADCWAQGGGQATPSYTKAEPDKGKPKGKGKKGKKGKAGAKGVRSLEEEWNDEPEQEELAETGFLSTCLMMFEAVGDEFSADYSGIEGDEPADRDQETLGPDASSEPDEEFRRRVRLVPVELEEGGGETAASPLEREPASGSASGPVRIRNSFTHNSLIHFKIDEITDEIKAKRRAIEALDSDDEDERSYIGGKIVKLLQTVKELRESRKKPPEIGASKRSHLDQTEHDRLYYSAIELGASHSVAWHAEKKRRRAEAHRLETLPERGRKRRELEKDWHETHDTEPVDERDFEANPEALAADFEGEVIVEREGDLTIHGGKLVSAKAGHRDPKRRSDKELTIDEKELTQYRKMSQEEKEDYRQQTKEEEEEYLERRARVDYVTKPLALKRTGPIAKATQKDKKKAKKNAEIECRNFWVGGYCKWGKSCWFKHEEPAWQGAPKREHRPWALRGPPVFGPPAEPPPADVPPAEPPPAEPDSSPEFNPDREPEAVPWVHFIEKRESAFPDAPWRRGRRERTPSESVSASSPVDLGSLASATKVTAGKEWKKVKINLDTGAAITAIPRNFAESYPLSEKNTTRYRTASAEEICDEGGRFVLGSDAHGNKLAINGRVANVHKVLASGVKVSERNDIWLGNDGGYIMPRHGPIAKEMRAHFEKVRLKYDEEDITPVYQERGTFVFDFWIKPHVKGKVPTASVDTAHKTLAPLAERQEGVFLWPPRTA